jgi:hypothetical protein
LIWWKPKLSKVIPAFQAMFGVLRGIEALSTVEDLKKNTNIKPWFDRMKHAVESHQGANLIT